MRGLRNGVNLLAKRRRQRPRRKAISPRRATRSARTKGNPSKEEVAVKVKELILERGLPIARNDLFEALESRGIIIRGADPKVVLGTMLWRTEDIIRLRGHGYWLKNRPFEPAGYNPKRPPFEDTMSEHAKGAFEDILT
jgi:hypothetical protein